jgi:hypothetical protein
VQKPKAHKNTKPISSSILGPDRHYVIGFVIEEMLFDYQEGQPSSVLPRLHCGSLNSDVTTWSYVALRGSVSRECVAKIGKETVMA